MSFVKKIKDILFEEEDFTEEIKTVEEPVKEPKIVKIESLKDTNYIEKPKEVEEEKSQETFSRVDKSFVFPDFDEEEFQSNVSRVRNNNVLDYERKKKEEKKDYSRFDRVDSVRDTEKKKFKPSPIISPVYGILNQDYKAEDIINRNEDASNISIEEVRKKAFEPKVEEKKEIVKEVIDEPVVTFFEEKDVKVDKSVDELLEDASEEISLEDTLELPTISNIDAIEEELEKLDEEEKVKPAENNNDELDNDLFELIDSMYDDRGEV